MWQELIQEFEKNWQGYLTSAVVILAAAAAGFIAQFLISRLIRAISRKKTDFPGSLAVKHLRWPLRFALPIVFIAAASPFVKAPPSIQYGAGIILTTLLIVVFAWTAIKALSIVVDWSERRLRGGGRETLRDRRIFTQVRIIKRIVATVVVFVAAAIILLQFKEISNLGTTLLASAGVIGIVVGFAAQRSLGTFFAGFQIALTQPIRIDDVVVVEGEWGTIEEITLTYVVVRIWDLRRLILPVTYFLEKPFQNWTRTSAAVMGTVFLYADYTAPVAALRDKLKEVVTADPLWDKKVCVLQVTDTRDRTVELRALVSAADSPSLWDLRCHVREELVRFLTETYPLSLPRFRAVLDKEDPHEPRKTRGPLKKDL
ncbi:MAG: mechanosensitive ion channel [Spirochaetales bacterium]|nr:mechanosensitive ion channel [Spirochaetales bacterium]